ncbi:MAG: gliding motility protein GldM [Cyclobacteriaceae bacterium]|nr:gliding motility protein GldM [Cyclobacteriaceae bacterium HetDA_MAG_MS6]
MAGGKETPRQKMIGMMYLVLTALLALNVSSTVIDKFVFINESLVRANNESGERNAQTLVGIKKAVDDTGNRDADVAVMTSSEELRAETKRVISELNEIKKAMIEMTGNYEEGHEPEYVGDAKYLTGKTDYDKIGNYMMPVEEGGDGHGTELRDLLNGYSQYVKDLLGKHGAKETELEHYGDIAVDAVDDPVYQRDPNQAGKKFSQLAFESSPTPASLATMSEFQSRVLGYETRAMDFLSKKVGAGDISFDQIVAMVKPESKYVAAGTKYAADMFIAASASGITPTMTYNGNAIPVENGTGRVEFTATPGNYDAQGNARKTFEAAITVPVPGGGDTTYTNTIEYYVVKPVIQIQSQSVNALYLNCGNKLDVQVPALGNAYNPAFTAKGGYALKGQARGQVTVVPNSANVSLTVSSNGNTIGNRKFGVRRIPAPEIKAFTDRGEVNLKTGISAKSPKLYLRAIPDESFQQFLPDDAKFRVAEAEITLVSGGIGRQTIRVGQEANLEPIAARARKGDQLVIEIKKVQRQNFRGQVEEFRNHTKFINISLK